jgi:dolichol kinase
MDVEENTCEQCDHQEDEKKDQRLCTAFVKLVLGIVFVIVSVVFDAFALKLAGFIVLLFALLKLLEITTLGQGTAPHKP